MPKPVRSSIESLYYDLDRLADEHEELTDTDVREAIHLALNFFFVWGKESAELPVSFGMFSEAGGRALADAIKRFLAATRGSDLDSIATGKNRLDLLQDRTITTGSGRRYDEFIGHLEEPLPARLPDWMREPAAYDEW